MRGKKKRFIYHPVDFQQEEEKKESVNWDKFRKMRKWAELYEAGKKTVFPGRQEEEQVEKKIIEKEKEEVEEDEEEE